MLRILHSRSVAEADTEAVAVVVPMEEAEVASTVAVVEAADSMEVVAGRIAAEVVVCTAAGRPVARPEAWVHMDAAAECMAAGVRMAHMAERVRME